MNVPIVVIVKSDTVTPQLKRMMETLGTSGRNRLLTMMATKFTDLAKSTFGSGGSRFRGNKWPSYSKAYAKKVGSKTPTLYRTGKLKGSIRYSQPRGSYITVYTMNPYAGAHMFGTKTGIPARRFFPVESNGSSMWRLTYNAEREIVSEISRGMSLLSGGVFPRIAVTQIGRSAYSYGNPRTAGN